MNRKPVDLSSHINQDVRHGHPAVYRAWNDLRVRPDEIQGLLQMLPERPRGLIASKIIGANTAFEAYNAATYVATHEMRSARIAFELLDQINAVFQSRFSVRALAKSVCAAESM